MGASILIGKQKYLVGKFIREYFYQLTYKPFLYEYQIIIIDNLGIARLSNSSWHFVNTLGLIQFLLKWALVDL